MPKPLICHVPQGMSKSKFFCIFNISALIHHIHGKVYFSLESRSDAHPKLSQTVLNFEGPKHFIFTHLDTCTAASKWSK